MGWSWRLVTKQRQEHCSFDVGCPLLLDNPPLGGLSTQLQIQFWGLQDLNFVLSIHSNLDEAPFQSTHTQTWVTIGVLCPWHGLKWIFFSLSFFLQNYLTKIMWNLRIPRLFQIIWFEKWEIKRRMDISWGTFEAVNRFVSNIEPEILHSFWQRPKIPELIRSTVIDGGWMKTTKKLSDQ